MSQNQRNLHRPIRPYPSGFKAGSIFIDFWSFLLGKCPLYIFWWLRPEWERPLHVAESLEKKEKHNRLIFHTSETYEQRSHCFLILSLAAFDVHAAPPSPPPMRQLHSLGIYM